MFVIFLLNIILQIQRKVYFIQIIRDGSFYSERKTKEHFRLNVQLMIDILSIVPLDYIMWNNEQYGTWFRLLRFLKMYRLKDAQEVMRRFFSSFHLFNIIILVVFYMLASHIGACILYVIALFEYNRGGRFDGKDFVRIPNNNIVVH